MYVFTNGSEQGSITVISDFPAMLHFMLRLSGVAGDCNGSVALSQSRIVAVPEGFEAKAFDL